MAQDGTSPGAWEKALALLDRAKWPFVAVVVLVAVASLTGAALLAYRDSASGRRSGDTAAAPKPIPPPSRPPMVLERSRIPTEPRLSLDPTPSTAGTMAVRPTAAGGSSRLIGFYVNWDQASYDSLAANIDQLTALMPMWYHLENDGHLRLNDSAKQAEALALIRARRPALRVMPIVNYHDAEKNDIGELASLLSSAETRESVAEEIVTTFKAGGFAGVNIDFEGLPGSSKADLTAFMETLVPKAHAAGLEVSQCFTVAGSAYDVARLGQVNDYVLPMMYDEHWKSAPAGPIASQGWYERRLGQVFEKVPAEKVVVALGLWTYDWGSEPTAKAYKHAEALALASQHGSAMQFDPVYLNPMFAYEQDGVAHRVWMLDAATLFNQVKWASARKPNGYALWRLGQEDAAVWSVLPKRDTLGEAEAKALEGWGRSIDYDASRGLIVGERLSR